MKKAFDRIHYLIDNEARHRKGFSLHNCVPMMAVKHCREEAQELYDEVYNKGDILRANGDAILLEMADVLSCVFHLAIMLDVNEKVLEEAILKKLDMRFTIP